MPYFLDQIISLLFFSPPPMSTPLFSYKPLSSVGSALSEGEIKITSHQADEGKWELGNPQPVLVRGKGANPRIAACRPVFSEYCVEKGMVRRSQSEKKIKRKIIIHNNNNIIIKIYSNNGSNNKKWEK
jgi:hypothetical protein